MALTAERIGILEQRHAALSEQLASLRAAPPAKDATKTAARAWSEAVDSLQSLVMQMERVLRSSKPKTVAHRPGDATLACIRKGEGSEVRVGLINLPNGRAVEIRRWRVPRGEKELAPAARAIVVDLRALRQLSAALLVAEEALETGTQQGDPDA